MVRTKARKQTAKKSRAKETSEKRKLQIKTSVQACFRAAFAARKSSELPNINRQYQEAYVSASEVEELSEYFLHCQRFAIELLCVNGAKDGRVNCMRMVANVALVLGSNGIPEPLDALVELVTELNDVSLINARVFACQLVAQIFLLSAVVDGLNAGSNGGGEDADRNDDEDMNREGLEEGVEDGDRGDVDAPAKPAASSLSSERRSVLYKVILSRELDTSPAVRLEAIRAFGNIQSERYPFTEDDPPDLSPKQVVLRHLMDIAWDCRVASIKCLSLDTNDDLNYVVGRAFNDLDVRVRRAAFSRLAQDVHIKRLSIAIRMKVLKHMLSANEAIVRVIALRMMVKKWLGDMCDDEEVGVVDPVALPGVYCTSMARLFDFLEPVNEEEVTHDVMIVALRCCRQRMDLEKEDVHRFVQSIVDNGEDNFIHRYNFKNLLNATWRSSKRAKRAFMWRCVVDFCKAECVTEADWSECRCRLVPTLHTYCEFVRKFIEAEPPDDGPELFIFMRISMLQLLKIIPVLELDDGAGRKTLRDLIEFILTTRKTVIAKEVIDCAVQQLFDFFFPNPEDFDDGLSYICDLTSMMVHRSVDPDASMRMPNETIAITAPESGNELPEQPEADEDTLLRCVTIVNAMIRTKRLQRINALIRGLLENVIEKGALSSCVECRVLSLEAMGAMALFDKRLAFEKTAYLKDVLEVEDNPQMKVAALKVICKHCLRHGYKSVSRWFVGETDFGDPSCDLLKVLCDYADHEDGNVSFAACELLCKLLLNGVEVDEIRKIALCRIVLKSLDPMVKNNLKLKQCLSCFVQVYAEIDRDHQLYYVDIFTDVFDALSSALENDPLTRIDPMLVADLFVHITCLQMLGGRSKKDGSVHPVLARRILARLANNLEEKFVHCYCKMLVDLDVHIWTNVDDLYELMKETDEVIEQFEALEKPAKALRPLTVFADKLRKQLAKVDTPTVENSPSAVGDDATEELIDRTANLALGNADAVATPAVAPRAAESARASKGPSSSRKRAPRLTKTSCSRGLAKALFGNEQQQEAEEGQAPGERAAALFSGGRTPLTRRPRRAVVLGTPRRSPNRMNEYEVLREEDEPENPDDSDSSEGSPTL